MEKTILTLRRIFKEIPKVLLWMGAMSVLLMAVLICYDVAMRYFFNAPKSWAIEIAQYLMLAVFFLPLAYVQQDRRHIKVELFVSHLPIRIRKILTEVVIPLLALAVNGAILWQVGRLAMKLLRRGTVSATSLRVPLFPISMILVIAFFAAIVVFLVQFRKGSGKKETMGKL